MEHVKPNILIQSAPSIQSVLKFDLEQHLVLLSAETQMQLRTQDIIARDCRELYLLLEWRKREAQKVRDEVSAFFTPRTDLKKQCGDN